jgi:hypothetical protein
MNVGSLWPVTISRLYYSIDDMEPTKVLLLYYLHRCGGSGDRFQSVIIVTPNEDAFAVIITY